MMNCTAMAHNTSPISRVRMRIPVWASRRSMRVAAASVTEQRYAVSPIATYTAAVVSGVFAAPLSTITVEIAPGPANMGMPSGMIPTSSFSIPSAFSTGVSRCWLRRACTMSSALSPITTPPAILNAAIVMPKRRKIRLPPKANAVRVTAQVQAPRRAMSRRTGAGSRAVIARKVGTAVSGSTMNSTDVSTRNRSWSVFSICSHRHLDHAVFAGSLGLVHRVVRFAQQFVAPRLGARDGDDADAGGDGGRPAEHRTDPAGEAIGDRVGHAAVGLRHQDAELVATQPAHEIGLAHRAAHRVGDEPQDRVAGGVAVRVVDPLEVVQVEIDQSQRPAVATVAAQLLRHLGREGPRVQHRRERIVRSEQLELRLGTPQLRQAGDRHAHDREVRDLVEDPDLERRLERQLVDPDAEAEQRRREREGNAPPQAVLRGSQQYRDDVQD